MRQSDDSRIVNFTCLDCKDDNVHEDVQSDEILADEETADSVQDTDNAESEDI